MKDYNPRTGHTLPWALSSVLLLLLWTFPGPTVAQPIPADQWPGPTALARDAAGRGIWSALPSRLAPALVTYTVHTFAPAAKPTLVYNCYNMPSICNNIAQAHTLPHSGDYVYDTNGVRVEARRDDACPGNWIKVTRQGVAGQRCPEPGQPAVITKNERITNAVLHHTLDTTQTPPQWVPHHNRISRLTTSVNPQGVQSYTFDETGMVYSCDEFPPASFIQGGNNAVTYCAPLGKKCDLPGSSLPKVRSEQDWQSFSHTSLRNAGRKELISVFSLARFNDPNDAEATLFEFAFKTVNVADTTAAYIEVNGAAIKTYPLSKRALDVFNDYPGISGASMNYLGKGIGAMGLGLSKRTNDSVSETESAPEEEGSTHNASVLPVQQDHADAPPLPIIDLSVMYILGQVNSSHPKGHNNETVPGAQNSTTGTPRIRRGSYFRQPPPGSNYGRSPVPLQPLQPISKRQTDPGPIQCGPGNPCADKSCCNSAGKCGFKDAHCGTTCISNCDAKAMCGIDSLDGAEKCGLSLCCSYYGWCGTESVHCIDPEPQFGLTPCQEGFGGCEIIPPPVCGEGSGTASGGRKIAYYQSWNVRDRPCNRIRPYQIDTTGLTHLNFAFAFIDPISFHVAPMNPDDEQLYIEFNALQRPGLQTWIAIGGYSMSDPGPWRTTWSDMAGSAANRAAFIQSCITFMETWGFQGVDLDWEYPGSSERGGRREDTENLVLLVKEMREAFGTNYGLSSILAPDYWYLRYFDPKAMEPYVDFFGFMSYDLHGSWDADVQTLGSIVRPQTDIREIDKGLLPLWFAGVNPAKVNFGLAYYGRGYTLASSTCPWMGCSFVGPNHGGKCTGFDGVLSNLEIKALIQEKGLVPDLVEEAMIKQITWDGNQWMGYDDEETMAMKTAYANNRCLGGTMIWSIDFDSGIGSGSNPVIGTYLSPQSATIVPIASITYAPAQTFTLDVQSIPQVTGLRNQGDQNTPPGPGAPVCLECDLARLLTSTCCGVGGSISNPIYVPPNVPLPKDLVLPKGFIPEEEIEDSQGIIYPGGLPLPRSITIAAGYAFSQPLRLAPGSDLSPRDTWDDTVNSGPALTIYIISTFWEKPAEQRTVFCNPPCVIVFPPYPVTTTWTPPPVTTEVEGTTFTLTPTPSVHTTEKFHVSKVTLNKKTTSPPGSEPTQTDTPGGGDDDGGGGGGGGDDDDTHVKPKTGPTLCSPFTLKIPFPFNLIVDSLKQCPPPDVELNPPDIPPVVIHPVPNGGSPGPTNPGNTPTDEQKEEEKEEEDEENNGETCPFNEDDSRDPLDDLTSEDNTGSGDGGDGGDSSTGGTGGDGAVNAPSFPTVTATGGGNIVTVTVTVDPVVVTVTQWVDPPPKPSDPPQQEPQPSTEKTHCYKSGQEAPKDYFEDVINQFCKARAGATIYDNRLLETTYHSRGDFWFPWLPTSIDVSVQGLNNCRFTVSEKECKRILWKGADCKDLASRRGGRITSNCALWRIDPQGL